MRAVPTTLPEFAAITTVPAACAVTRPALLTDATASLDDDHRNSLFGIGVPLEFCAVATSCRCSPTRTLSSDGLTTTTANDDRSAGSARAGLARCAFRSASCCKARRHCFDLLKPLAAEKLEKTPHATPTTST